MTRIGDNALIKLAQNGLSRDQVQELVLEYEKVVEVHQRIANEHEAMATKLRTVLKDKETATQPDE